MFHTLKSQLKSWIYSNTRFIAFPFRANAKKSKNKLSDPTKMYNFELINIFKFYCFPSLIIIINNFKKTRVSSAYFDNLLVAVDDFIVLNIMKKRSLCRRKKQWKILFFWGRTNQKTELVWKDVALYLRSVKMLKKQARII